MATACEDCRSQPDRQSTCRTARAAWRWLPSEYFAFLREKVLDDRTKTERGEERQRTDDDDDAHQEAAEERTIGGERAGPGGHDLFVDHAARYGHDRDDHEEAAE